MEIGKTVVYSGQVYKITEIKEQTIGKITRDYYVLSSVFDAKNTVYVPVDNETLKAKMKNLLTKTQIKELLRSAQTLESVWTDDDKERTQSFKKIIEQGQHSEIIKIIKTLTEHKKICQRDGKKLHTADEAVLVKAEKMFCEEISLVLEMKKEDVLPYIIKEIEQKN